LKRNSNIEIKYNEIPVKNLTVSKFAFWNGGKDTIDRKDIPDLSKLSIQVKDDIEIYDARIVYATDEANSVRLNKQDKNIVINFEYLDFHQGALIKIIHSGNSSEDLIISGKIKGVGDFKVSNENPYDEDPIIAQVVFLIISLIILISSFFSHKTTWKTVLISLGLLFFWGFIKMLGEKKFPKNLKYNFFD
jgi:hypothetical protein